MKKRLKKQAVFPINGAITMQGMSFDGENFTFTRTPDERYQYGMYLDDMVWASMDGKDFGIALSVFLEDGTEITKFDFD